MQATNALKIFAATTFVQAAVLRSKLPARTKTRQATSATDEEGYLAVCELAARYDWIFEVFKRTWHYRRVLEHVSQRQGLEYIEAIKEEDEQLLKYASKFQENDLLGCPKTFEYDVGRFSPTTLRYVKVLADLKNMLGDLSGLHVCEIGAGYGGQCKIISDVFNVASYTIVDLPTVLPLIRKYLERLGIRNVVYLTQDKISEQNEFDLLLSNYAFSECIKPVQDNYLEKILDKVPRGYITYNFQWILPVNEASPYNKEQIVERLSKKHVVRMLDEKPRTAPMNLVLVWDDEQNPASIRMM